MIYLFVIILWAIAYWAAREEHKTMKARSAWLDSLLRLSVGAKKLTCTVDGLAYTLEGVRPVFDEFYNVVYQVDLKRDLTNGEL